LTVCQNDCEQYYQSLDQSIFFVFVKHYLRIPFLTKIVVGFSFYCLIVVLLSMGLARPHLLDKLCLVPSSVFVGKLKKKKNHQVDKNEKI
jgi:hypothetical protein